MRKFIAFAALALSFNAFAEDSQACLSVQKVFISGDFAKAAAILEPLAAQGDDCAQTKLGYLYMQGRGVPANKDKALQLWEAAAAQGNQEAAVQVAFLKK